MWSIFCHGYYADPGKMLTLHFSCVFVQPRSKNISRDFLKFPDLPEVYPQVHLSVP